MTLVAKELTYLCEVRSLAGLVLGHLVQGVLAALLAFAEGLSLFGHVNHLHKQSHTEIISTGMAHTQKNHSPCLVLYNLQN